MRSWIISAVIAVLAVPSLPGAEKLTPEQRLDLVRGLTAEYATVKAPLPRSKKALKLEPNGSYDRKEWDEASHQYGPAARVGDLVQVTGIDIGDDSITLAINGGFNSGKGKWYQRIQVGGGMGGNVQTHPVSQGQTNAAGGTTLVLQFHKPVPPLKAAEIKKMLTPILDFEKHTAAENYIDSLPPEMQKAVKEKRAVEGMDRDMVILALGKPVRKIREVSDEVETECWVYGQPPGKIVFVTFSGNKVIKVKEDYAGLGQEAPKLADPR